MCVVEDVGRVQSEGCDGKIMNLPGQVCSISNIHQHQLCLKELGDVEDNCHDDGGQDVCEEVNQGGVTKLVTPVEKRLADCQVSLCRNTHDQECLPAQKDVLHGVKKVREEDGVEWIENVLSKVTEDETEEDDITGSQSYQALVKGGLHTRVPKNDYSHNIAQDSYGA